MDRRHRGVQTKVSKTGVTNSNAFQGQTSHLQESSSRTGEATEDGGDWCTRSHLDEAVASETQSVDAMPGNKCRPGTAGLFFKRTKKPNI